MLVPHQSIPFLAILVFRLPQALRKMALLWQGGKLVGGRSGRKTLVTIMKKRRRNSQPALGAGVRRQLKWMTVR